MNVPFARHDELALAVAETNLEHLLREGGSAPTTVISPTFSSATGSWNLSRGVRKSGRDPEGAVDFEAAEALVTQAGTEVRDQRPISAKRTLARSWSQLHQARGRIDPQCETLGRISGFPLDERVGARTVAVECKPSRFADYWLERYVALARILDAYTR